MTTDTRYPEIEVELSGLDGNVFETRLAVRKTLRRAGIPNCEVEQFTTEATGGNYEHLLAVCTKWVTVR